MNKLILVSLACYGIWCISIMFPILTTVALSIDNFAITYRMLLLLVIIFLGFQKD